ncbi:MAG: protein kinase [Myxococcota bacterium]|nr:protein kinase [Myxococcota bacterium]MDW8361709.1 serine/threonine-protein kinase [Myxococcales bacterium]
MGVGIPLGPYRLVKRLAVGGMAEIFLARKEGPEGFARELVVKRILPHLAEDRAFTEMFLEEARIAARLSHPNVVTVFDFGQVEGSYYLVMELVRGVDLAALIRRAREAAGVPWRAIPPHHAAKILSFVCEGLAHAHGLVVDGRPAGLVHRDITPSNVLVSFEGAVKVADFGIAKAMTRRRRDETVHGVVKGKHAYMSPEQARGERLDARSDLFNVGILLFESLLGTPLFPHDDLRAARMLSAAGRIPEPERLDRLPEPLAGIARRALAPNREERYPDALTLRADLEAFVRSCEETSDPVEIGRFVRALFPDVLAEDAVSPRAAGTVPATMAAGASQATVLPAVTAVMRQGSTEDATALVASPMPPALGVGRGAPAAEDEPTRRAATMSGAAAAVVDAARGRRGRLSSARRRALWLALGAMGAFALGGVLAVILDAETPASSDARAAPQLAMATLRVATEPGGAQVRVDGVVAGSTPVVLEVAPGERIVEVLVSGRVAARQRARLAPGETASMSFVLGIAPPATDPPAATPFSAHDENAAQAPDASAASLVGADVAPASGERPFSTRVSANAAREPRSGPRRGAKAGAASRDRTRVDRGPSSETAGYGTLAVATTPWSDVYIGNRHLGTTPLGAVRLPAGTYELTLRAPGRPTRTERVTIRSGEPTRVRLVL